MTIVRRTEYNILSYGQQLKVSSDLLSTYTYNETFTERCVEYRCLDRISPKFDTLTTHFNVL